MQSRSVSDSTSLCLQRNVGLDLLALQKFTSDESSGKKQNFFSVYDLDDLNYVFEEFFSPCC